MTGGGGSGVWRLLLFESPACLSSSCPARLFSRFFASFISQYAARTQGGRGLYLTRMPPRRRLGPRLTLAQVKAVETDKMRRRTETRIRELMGHEEDSDSDSEEEERRGGPVHQGMRTISLFEFVVYGLLWFLIVCCAAFFRALLRHPA